MMKLILGKAKHEFSELQAQRMLQIQRKMKSDSWKLPNDSPYEFKDNALIKRTDTADCNRKAKRKGATGGKKPSGQAEVSHRDDSE